MSNTLIILLQFFNVGVKFLNRRLFCYGVTAVCSSIRAIRRSWNWTCFGVGDCDDLWIGVHCVRYSR
jgi:hypothetical protein